MQDENTEIRLLMLAMCAQVFHRELRHIKNNLSTIAWRIVEIQKEHNIPCEFDEVIRVLSDSLHLLWNLDLEKQVNHEKTPQ